MNCVVTVSGGPAQTVGMDAAELQRYAEAIGLEFMV